MSCLSSDQEGLQSAQNAAGHRFRFHNSRTQTGIWLNPACRQVSTGNHSIAGAPCPFTENFKVFGVCSELEWKQISKYETPLMKLNYCFPHSSSNGILSILEKPLHSRSLMTTQLKEMGTSLSLFFYISLLPTGLVTTVSFTLSPLSASLSLLLLS